MTEADPIAAARISITPADLEPLLTGLWAIFPSRRTFTGKERFRRWPVRHIAFDGPAWQLYFTGRRRRVHRSVGISRGFWRIIDLDGPALLVLTVRSYEPSAGAREMLQSNYGYTGGAMVVAAADTTRDEEAAKMRDGEARMYFLPVRVGADELILTLPSIGTQAPRQRWARVATT